MAHNMTLLDEGTLYVAKLSSDIPAGEIDGSGHTAAGGAFEGSGIWLAAAEVGSERAGRVTGRRLHRAGVAVFTLLAADKAGATRWTGPRTSRRTRRPARCTSR